MLFTKRPLIAIKLAVLLAICIACFLYLESHTQVHDKMDEALALIGATLVAVGLDTFIDWAKHYTSECKDI